ncbi:MAG: DUF1489 family protein [Marivivens sp.]|nr:DUF1489 family protein [Marivivens sp.]
MPLHLKKLSVGSTSIDSLREWHKEVLARRGRIIHVTRSFPRRAEEILPGGSIYWVIKGKMCARQLIEEFIEVERDDGGVSCGIVMKPGLIPVFEKRHRPFQGWRYLEEKDVPLDLPTDAEGEDTMPMEMAEELRDLGLL